MPRRPELTGPRCASVNGFSLHAKTDIAAHRRDQSARLIRYTARGAVSLERLEQDANGDLLYRFRRPWSDGATGIKLAPLELLEKLAAIVPLPHAHLVRCGGCLAPHSTLRAAISPTPRQQGVDGEQTKPGTPYWNWARLLGRVFAVDMTPCPFCRRGSLRIIAAILPPLCGRRELAIFTQESMMPRILRHLQLASVSPPIAPARLRQELFAFDDARAGVDSEATCGQRRAKMPLILPIRRFHESDQKKSTCQISLIAPHLPGIGAQSLQLQLDELLHARGYGIQRLGDRDRRYLAGPAVRTPPAGPDTPPRGP